ncbi:MAG: hydroxyacid dehydrogenase [Gemmatimonadaceae bacterium]|nr:hydroxyacid dehydrogenase [Gemmatimonadaceae bacterium]
MPNPLVAVTDHVFPDLEPTKAALASVGAEVNLARSGSAEDILDVARGADAVINCFAQLPGDVINQFEQCRIIARTGIGIDTIDLDVATTKGIVVTNVPEYCEDEVSDHAMALLLALARNVTRGNAQVHGGEWALAKLKPMFRLRGRTVGLVGFGKIPRLVAAKAQAFGLNVVAFDPYIEPSDAASLGVELLSLEELMANSDFVSIHTPLTPETRHMIGADVLAGMKPEAMLINTARGGLVDVDALADALDAGSLAGAGLDVLPDEPPTADLRLMDRDNVILTPHTAFYSEQSMIDLQAKAAQQVALVLAGEQPQYAVNLDKLN